MVTTEEALPDEARVVEPGWRRVLRRLGSGTTLSVFIAILIGAGGGGFAAFFRWLVLKSRQVFMEDLLGVLQGPLGSASEYAIITIPVVGGLIVGPLVYFLAREAKGHGVPEVMEAVALRGGRIRPRVIAVKALASAITIGSGGSVGREGPIVQMGSAIGSMAGQLLRASQNVTKTFVGCGAAAGIAGTFNAPIAGVIFAQEVILGEFSAATFSLVVISSVTSSVVSRGLLGDMPAFVVPSYQLVSPVELLFYAALGVLAGLVGVGFTRIIYWSEDRFDAWRAIPPYLKPAVGLLLVGGIGFFFPQIFGVGYETIDAILEGGLGLGLLLALLVFKVAATAITLGAGGSGGIMAPSLFLGATLGGIVGTLVHGFYPAVTAASGAYALVGMGGVLAATTQAPIQAILIIFEMTRDYRIILAVMIVGVIGTLVSSTLSSESIYTMKLARRGIRIRGGRDENVLRDLRVAEAMTRHPVSVHPNWTLEKVIRVMQDCKHTGFPVIDGDGRLVGMITLEDIRATHPDEPARRLAVPVRQVMSRSLITVHADDSLNEALHRFGVKDVGRLPVVDRSEPDRLVGLITRSDIIKAYNRRTLDHPTGERKGREAGAPA